MIFCWPGTYPISTLVALLLGLVLISWLNSGIPQSLNQLIEVDLSQVYLLLWATNHSGEPERSFDRADASERLHFSPVLDVP